MDFSITIVTPENLSRFLTKFQQAEVFSFDFETPNVFPYDKPDYMRVLAIAFGNEAWVIPLEMPFSPFQGRPKACDLLMNLILDLAKGKTSVAQNGKFDNHWFLVYHDRMIHLDFDTMLADHVLNENAKHDLEALAERYLGEAAYDIPLAEKNGSKSWSLFHKGKHAEVREVNDRVYTYAGRDAFYTLQTYHILRKKLQADKTQHRLFYKLVMPGARVMEKVEPRGITLDLAEMKKVELDTNTRLTAQLEILNSSVRRKIRPGVKKKINWNSPKQIGELLYNDLKLPVVERTPTGAPSTGEAAIFALKGQHPVVDALTEYRELEKFRSTYIDGWKPLIIGDKIHFSYKIHGTVTGRYSSRLHQIPRDGRIRNLAKAPPGWTFFQADVSQAELRIAAVASGDLELITCFTRGIDVHWRTLMYLVATGSAPEYLDPAIETAQHLAADPEDIPITKAVEILLKNGHDKAIAYWKPWKEARKKAKAVNFGFIYGMHENKFIETAKLKYGFTPTFEEAAEIRKAYFRLYNGLLTWHERQRRFVKLDGFVRSLSGRLRRLPAINDPNKWIRMEAERQAINSPIQGFIGDYKVMALIEIEETIPNDQALIVGEHHDAILGIVREGCENEVLPQIHRIMKKPSLLETFGIEIPIPMESDIELGPWGKGVLWTPPKS